MDKFKQVQHLALVYRVFTKEELTIVNHLSSFSALTSLHINIITRKDKYHDEDDYDDEEEDDDEDEDDNEHEDGDEHGHDEEEKILMDYLFRQNCPFLQRLYIYGCFWEPEIMNNVCMFYFPSLLYIHVDKLHFSLALQLLNQCCQLRSFSAEIDHEETDYSTIKASPILLSLLVSSAPALTALTKLDLRGLTNCNPFWVEFLEHLLPCCPYLRKFLIKIRCTEYGQTLLEADWWTHVFASNNELQKISLHLKWSTRNYEYNCEQEAARRFRSSTYFTQLKVNVKFSLQTDQPWFLYDLYIKN
jgi:hypothetical protein